MHQFTTVTYRISQQLLCNLGLALCKPCREAWVLVNSVQRESFDAQLKQDLTISIDHLPMSLVPLLQLQIHSFFSSAPQLLQPWPSCSHRLPAHSCIGSEEAYHSRKAMAATAEAGKRVLCNSKQ